MSLGGTEVSFGLYEKTEVSFFTFFWDRSVFFPDFFTKKVKPWHSHTAIQRKPPRKQLQVTYKSDSRYWTGIPKIVLRILKNGLGFYWDSILPGFKKMKVFFSGIPRKQSVGFQMGYRLSNGHIYDFVASIQLLGSRF